MIKIICIIVLAIIVQPCCNLYVYCKFRSDLSSKNIPVMIHIFIQKVASEFIPAG